MNRVVFFLIILAFGASAIGQEPVGLVYVNISPAFVTNYDEGARLKYLKASVSLRVQGERAASVRYHLPSIKNALVILFSAQAEENLTSTVGRETLRREALDEVRQTMALLEVAGDQSIDDLFFTDFVIQQ